MLGSPPKLPRPQIRPPSAEQVARIVGAARDHGSLLGLAVWLAAVTGARRGQLCGLRWCDVDLDSRSVVIRRSVVEAPGQLIVKDPKTHRVRRVALDDATCGLLRARQASQAEAARAARVALDEDPYVLSEEPAGMTPLDPRRLSHRFRRLARRASIECRLHDLRHWHVTQALGAGLPVRDVAERVGHASARMTLDVYGHAIKGADRGATETVASLLRDALRCY